MVTSFYIELSYMITRSNTLRNAVTFRDAVRKRWRIWIKIIKTKKNRATK